MWPDLVPKYKSKSIKNLQFTFDWDKRDAEKMREISARRCDKRIASYIIPGELERSRGSIRFGVKKEGHGYHGKRGDFCLVGASYRSGHLHVLYSRVELIGGFHFDLAVFSEVEKVLGRITDVTIYAPHAFVFALKGNSNEKLYKKLNDYYAKKRTEAR
jgi:hypothetical protein